ncbi:MAG: hypothetical protein JRF71_09885 [Deltaproteobacteria bacterium]|nr:hypothetical protein [Deltaproteobacteria bacterium]
MDNEIIFKQFGELEKKIERLMRVCKSYEATNLEFTNKIERLEEELRGKVEAENSYNQERELIRSRIDNLLVKLPDIEED